MLKIFTNQVRGGWSPNDLEKFLGGSEESIVLLAEALTRAGKEVKVYHNPRDGTETERNGVKYQDHSMAEFWASDEVITFRTPVPWQTGATAAKQIHYTCDVEFPWDTTKVTYAVISKYGAARNVFVENPVVMYLGVDIESLEKNKQQQVPGTMLYSASPDRGLETLLKDWEEIHKRYGLELRVTYDDLQIPGVTCLGRISKDEMEQEFWKAEYWVHPVNRPDSELFCLNAVKARHCECKRVIKNVGALKETAGDYIDYDGFVKGSKETIQQEGIPIMDWDEMAKNWLTLLERV